MPAPVVREILDALNREVLNQLDLAGAVTHRGEGGRARERIISSYLRRVVPAGFGIDTGFVIDAQGGISRQLDLVVYRTNYHPVFEIGGIKHFMVESVVAVLENKAAIGSRAVLREAMENICSAKALDRTNGGQNYIVVGTQEGAKVNPDDFRHQIFGAIVTERSLAPETLSQEWKSFLREHPSRREWPNFYADVRGQSAFYLRSTQPAQATVIPAEATHFGIVEGGDVGPVPSLLGLTLELINWIRVAAVIDFSPRDYLFKEGGKVRWWAVDEQQP